MAVNRQRGWGPSLNRPGDSEPDWQRQSPDLSLIKSRPCDEPVSVIYVGREREERKILAIHVVLEIEHSRKSRPGDFRLLPRTVRPL